MAKVQTVGSERVDLNKLTVDDLVVLKTEVEGAIDGLVNFIGMPPVVIPGDIGGVGASMAKDSARLELLRLRKLSGAIDKTIEEKVAEKSTLNPKVSKIETGKNHGKRPSSCPQRIGEPSSVGSAFLNENGEGSERYF